MQNHAYFSECIRLERGVRQGCPLSFPLYCTQNDVFTNRVNKDPNIKGFKLAGRKETLKLLQYADDTSFILTNFADIPFIFEQFSRYKTATGCLLNINKTEGLLIQTNRVFYYNNKFLIKWKILLSKLWYVCSIFPLPKNIIPEINKIIFKFLWNNKNPEPIA